MIYTDIEIEAELNELELKCEVFYVGLLPSFIWDRKFKKVVDYHSTPSKDHDLIVVETELIQLDKFLKNFLKEKNVNDQNTLVFCVNKQFFPLMADKNKKWVRVKIF